MPHPVSTRGFTVIESVMAFTLLSLGLLAAVALLNTSFMLSARSRHYGQAEQLLNYLAEFYSQDYVHGYTDTVYNVSPVVAADQVVYRRQFRLSTYSTDLAVPIRRLEVKVAWDWKGQTNQKTRVRLLCRPGR